MTDAKEIDDLANELKTESAKLNKAAPTVSQLLRLAEEKLTSADPGVEAWTTDLIEPTEPAEWWSEENNFGDKLIGTRYHAYQVGYSRVADGWGLAARVVEVSKPDHGIESVIVVPWFRIGYREASSAPETAKVVPLRNAPMGVRIAALGEIPEIFRLLTERVRARNLAIEEATKR